MIKTISQPCNLDCPYRVQMQTISSLVVAVIFVMVVVTAIFKR